MMLSTDIGVWTASLLTIAVLSGFFKENRLFRFAEAVFIGVSAGYFSCVWLITVIEPSINEAVSGNLILLIPVIAGLMLFLPGKIRSRYSQLAELPAASIVVLYIAIAIPLYFEKYIFEMIQASVMPLIVTDAEGIVLWIDTVSAWISITGTVSVLWFFAGRFYKQGEFYRFSGEVGRFYILVALGCTFGYTLLSRTVLLLGRFDFILIELFGFRF